MTRGWVAGIVAGGVGVLMGMGGIVEGGAKSEQVRTTGVVTHPDGRPAAGTLVTAALADGRSVTVYAGRDGRYALPAAAEGAATVTAWLPGVGRASGDPAGEGLTLDAADGAAPAGSGWLAAIPAGEDRRRFILDCTGCHVTDGSRIAPGGTRRSPEGWSAAVEMMRTNFGPASGFPIVSGWATPERLGPWLHDVFSDASPVDQPLAGPFPEPSTTGPVLTEYPVPVAQDLAHDLMVDDEGSVWVTGMFTHRMMRLDPASGTYDFIPIPVANANPRALDIDASGRIWVVLGAPGRVAIYDPDSATWSDYDVGMYAHSIMVGPDGRGWVNGHFTADPELIASVTAEGEVARYTVPPEAGSTGESTIPYGLRVGNDGIVWGTQLRGGRLVRLDPESGQVNQWEMPVSHAGPRRPDLGPDGTVWIPLYSANALARFDPDTERFTVWDFPVDGALPYVARVDPERGTVWIGTGHGDVAASFDPETERFTLYPLPTRGALVRHLDIDAARNEIWFAYGASPGIPGKILRLQPNG